MPKNIIFLDNPPKSDITPLMKAMKSVSKDPCEIRTVLNLNDLNATVSSGFQPDLILIDDLFCDEDQRGISLLCDLVLMAKDTPLVVILERANAARTAELIEAGATDVLIRDSNLEHKLVSQIHKIRKWISLIEHNQTLLRQNQLFVAREQEHYKMIGESPEMCCIFDKIKRVARIPRPVLITGERGTGKELVARAIHHLSVGHGKPMVVVNCAAFSEQLLESELFGHEKGAFTNADRQHIGKFEQADKGTLFLDEIGNMSIPFQKKIMRSVEYGTFRRVGGTREITVQTRIIAATNANLQKLIEAGKFLPDLYDRLAFEEIHLPPLRSRKGDIDVLANFFLRKFMEEVPDFQGKNLSQNALKQLRRYHFPGNIRELKNIIERAVYRDTTNEITAEDIGFLASGQHLPGTGSFKERVEAFEKNLVQEAINTSEGNQAAAARLLGISYHQLRYYLKKYQAD
jgi:DNA-binding NtrC family response regulator